MKKRNANRRVFLGSAVFSLAAGISGKVQSVPILSKNNYNLAYADAIRMNAWVEISVDAFRRNIQALRQKIGSASLCLVIKANAYGHGLDLLMPTIIESGCDILGFTANEEARIAREFDYKGRLIRIRSANIYEIHDAVKYNVEELIGGMDLSEEVDVVAKNNSIRIKVHLMLNSAGMGRNGLDLSTDGGRSSAKKIAHSLKNIEIVGISTHFPIENKGEVENRLARFHGDCAWAFSNTAIERGHVALHAANSYATVNVPEAHLDMVRCGASLYDSVLGEKQVMSFRSSVAAVLAYPKGAAISYDSTYVLRRDSRIANIPVGYSDGFRRVFSHSNTQEEAGDGAFILIKGYKAPVLGMVTMNTILADVTDFPDVVAKDAVVLLGQQEDAEISWRDWSRWAGGGLYELATLLGNASPKVINPYR